MAKRTTKKKVTMAALVRRLDGQGRRMNELLVIQNEVIANIAVLRKGFIALEKKVKEIMPELN